MGQRVDLRHRNGKMRVVLESQADAVRFSGKPEVRGIAVECRQCPSRGHLDCAMEFLGLSNWSRDAWCVYRLLEPRSDSHEVFVVKTLTGSVQCPDPVKGWFPWSGGLGGCQWLKMMSLTALALKP